MLVVDLHSHTLFSQCGLFTYMDLLTRAKAVGVEVLAITDHGSAVGGKIPGTFWERLRQPVEGVHLLKGMEANVIDHCGTIDMKSRHLRFCDILLMGLHTNLEPHQSESIYTDSVIKAMEKNPAVDIITHPNDPKFPVDFRAIAEIAKELGVALELNNSKILYKRATVERTRKMVEIFADVGVLLSVNSDSHALHEIGVDSSVLPIIEDVQYPSELLINRSVEVAMEFVDSRRKNKMGQQ